MELKQDDFILQKVINIFGKDLIQNVYLISFSLLIEDVEKDFLNSKSHLEHMNNTPNKLVGDECICILFKNGRLIQFNLEDGIYLISKG
jgi:hypothetical protein